MESQLLSPDLNFTKNFNEAIEVHGTGVLIGGIMSLLAIGIAGHHILFHLKYFNKPKIQLYIVRILLMVPVRALIKN